MRLSTNHAYGFLGTVSRFKSVSFFTLICFLLQILWPSFVLAGFDTFESQDYVRLQLKKVDDISYDLRILQKNAAGSQEINQVRIQKAQLQGNVNLSGLFHVNTLSASLRACQLLLNPDDQLLLTAQNPIQDSFSIHTNIPLILGGIQGTLVDCAAPILTTIERSHFDHLFYQPEDGQRGKLTFEHTQAQKGHFSICSADLFLKTALTFDQVHTYGDIYHHENTLYGSTLWLHGNNFLAHDDLVFETCEAQPLGSLALCDDGGVTATFQRLKGHFHHLKAHRGSSLFVRGLLNDSFPILRRLIIFKMITQNMLIYANM